MAIHKFDGPALYKCFVSTGICLNICEIQFPTSIRVFRFMACHTFNSWLRGRKSNNWESDIVGISSPEVKENTGT